MRNTWMMTAATAALATGMAWAQAASGTLSGRVTDPQGKAVPGAQVKITSNSIGAVREAQAGASGEFVKRCAQEN